MNRAIANSYRTAISRRSLSAPTKWLLDHDLIKGKVLDFGCGRGGDADRLRFDHGFECGQYDPHYSPFYPLDGQYDTIICNYVLNTVPEQEATCILAKINHLYHFVGGVAYITVRRDIKKPGYTKIGTYQRNVKLDLPIVHENKDFCIYRMTSFD